jgi:hypothetical protein
MSPKARRTLAGVTAAVMIAAPAAQARPIDSVQPGRAAHVAPPPSSIAQSVGMEYGDLRAQNPAPGNTGAVESRPIVETASAPGGGLDWTSVAIGAAVAAGLALVSWTAFGLRRTARA